MRVDRVERAVLPARLAALPAAAGEAAAAAAARALLLRFRLVDRQPASVEFLLIERAARGTALLVIRHFDERKAARAAGGLIADDANRPDFSLRCKELLELRFLGVERQISYVDSHSTFHLKGLEAAGLTDWAC